jgi:hypothetical protein
VIHQNDDLPEVARNAILFSILQNHLSDKFIVNSQSVDEVKLFSRYGRGRTDISISEKSTKESSLDLQQ